jgi:ABC-type phosphate transport system auxiliary subunit
MDTQLRLEERHVLLKSDLDEKLQKKHTLELEISKQFMELKRLETSLEKQVFKTVQKE